MANNEDSKAFGEDPLEQLLDEESDEEFGLPEFREHFADSLTPAVLKDWTAKDFASIYVRFRPHLERHARRYLRNPSQVEEVVQDAFLYLMTSLPELDSELGVLKFLKWKTRLLALDVIRANSRASFSPIDEVNELAAHSPELSIDLERADDAAIVSLAMAKLQPRQREALIATLYQEKAPEVVAAQMGLSDNAFRQLLFRARGAFRKALVGEAEIQGLRVSEILSLAARKAAAESGKIISAAGAFLVVLALSIGILPRFTSPQVSESEISLPAPQSETAPAPSTNAAADEITEPLEQALVDGEAPVAPREETNVVSTAVSTRPSQQTPVFQTAVFSVRDTYGDILSSARIAELNASPLLSGLSTTDLSDNRIYSLSNGSGLSAMLDFSKQNSDELQFARVDLEIGGVSFMALPKASGLTVTKANGFTTYYIGLGDFVLASNSSEAGNFVWENTTLGSAKVRLVLSVDELGQAVSGSIDISNR